MSTRELVENYTAYTDALEMSHSAAADNTARTSPLCILGSFVSTQIASAIIAPRALDVTFDHIC
jgi:hypothetical protein